MRALQNDTIDMKDLPDEILNPQLTVGEAVLRVPPEGVSMAQVEKELVLTALERTHWNQTRAAAFLRISRNVLIYRMQRYRLGPYKDWSADAAISEAEEDDTTFPLTANDSQEKKEQ